MTRKQWTTTIYIGRGREPETFYAEALAELREQVSAWLLTHQPDVFRNGANEDHADGFYFSDEPRRVRSVLGNRAEREPTLEEIAHARAYPWHGLGKSSHLQSTTLDSAVADFVRSLIPTKGPEWENLLLDENGVLQPHRIQTWHRESQDKRINDHLKRGWLIYTHDRAVDSHGDETVFAVLVHPEPDAV